MGPDLLDGVVPDLHRPVRAAGNEDLAVEGVPAHGIDSHVVRMEDVQELARVGLGTLQRHGSVGDGGRPGQQPRNLGASLSQATPDAELSLPAAGKELCLNKPPPLCYAAYGAPLCSPP